MDYTKEQLEYYKGCLEYSIIVYQDNIRKCNDNIYECMKNGQFLMIPIIRKKITYYENQINFIKDKIINIENTYGKGR